MGLTKLEIARMMDISCVRTYTTYEEIKIMAEYAMKEKCICGHVLPSHVPYLKSILKDNKDVLVGCPVGFPGGSVTTETKVFEMQRCVEMGADEIDIMLNITLLKSGEYKKVEQDLNAVVKAAGNVPTKAILEAMLLTDEQLRVATKIISNSGAGFVKTGTGWSEGPTTLHHIDVINEVIGKGIQIKASAGIRTYDQVQAFYDKGVTRFGVGFKSSIDILESCDK